MSKFPRWFTKAYNRWKKSQAGEEDFPAFCELLGYPATKVTSWLQGELEPQGAELLNIAGLCGIEVYKVLNQPEPDPELMKVYKAFSHLIGENRSKLGLALFEVQLSLNNDQKSLTLNETKKIIEKIFSKYGLINPD
jgi:hypothetical protein